jgi:hypothetical protein
MRANAVQYYCSTWSYEALEKVREMRIRKAAKRKGKTARVAVEAGRRSSGGLEHSRR